MTEPTTTVDTDKITTKLRDLLGPGANEEIVSELLDTEDTAAVAEAALALLRRIGAALRAQDIDPDVVLAAQSKPRSADARLAAALRRPAGQAYQGADQ